MSANIYNPSTKTLTPYAGGSATNLEEMSDVAITSPSNGQTLRYNVTLSKWENETPSGGGASAVSDLTDVELDNVEDGQVLKWNATDEVWENGEVGSSGGGHTIEDSDGTDLTQRDTLQFGEGFKAEDDDTNEKTVISPDVMQSGDMDDVITPLPSVAPKKEGIKYSTTEQVIGEWIDGKPLYQRSVSVPINISVSSSGFADVVAFDTTGCVPKNITLPRADNAGNLYMGDVSYFLGANANGYIKARTSYGGVTIFAGTVITVQYTKTTD